jgi:sulfur-oxidizing protein SoxY
MRGWRLAQLCLVAALTWAPPAIGAEPGTAWADIRAALFGAREIGDGAGVIALQAPDRAHDAAIVPVRIAALIPQSGDRYIKAITLVIDNNPAPIAGTFHLTPESGVASIATRVRVNEYTDIRAIAETSDGELYMASRFVKASGGCAAPALKDHEQAMARLGKMKLKHTPFRMGEPNEVQLLISHPNYTGLQIDQLSRNWIPPHFVRTIEVRYGGTPVMNVDGDISISENPSLHFSFVPEAEGELVVEARDTEGGTFSRSWPVVSDAAS